MNSKLRFSAIDFYEGDPKFMDTYVMLMDFRRRNLSSRKTIIGSVKILVIFLSKICILSLEVFYYMFMR